MLVTRHVTAPDGRILAVTESGDPLGAPILIHHGTPSSGSYVPPSMDALARAQGVRLIAYDRPGYAGSTRHPNRSVADCAGDVEAIADALELERYASWGISGGGPHVLACAALCDQRLVAIASLAAVAPYDAEGLDWYAGMGDGNIEEFGAVVESPDALHRFLGPVRDEHMNASADDIVAVMQTLLGPEDRSVLTGAFAEEVLESGKTGLRDGYDGWFDDDIAFARPWGFDVSQIDRPVLLVHGEDDRFVPVAHGHWLAARIPGVEARIDRNDGHLTLIARRLREVHEWLSAQL